MIILTMHYDTHDELHGTTDIRGVQHKHNATEVLAQFRTELMTEGGVPDPTETLPVHHDNSYYSVIYDSHPWHYPTFFMDYIDERNRHCRVTYTAQRLTRLAEPWE